MRGYSGRGLQKIRHTAEAREKQAKCVHTRSFSSLLPALGRRTNDVTGCLNKFFAPPHPSGTHSVRETLCFEVQTSRVHVPTVCVLKVHLFVNFSMHCHDFPDFLPSLCRLLPIPILYGVPLTLLCSFLLYPGNETSVPTFSCLLLFTFFQTIVFLFSTHVFQPSFLRFISNNHILSVYQVVPCMATCFNF